VNPPPYFTLASPPSSKHNRKPSPAPPCANAPRLTLTKGRLAVANLADIKNRMSAPAVVTTRQEASPQSSQRQYSRLAQAPPFGVCDLPKGDSPVGPATPGFAGSAISYGELCERPARCREPRRHQKPDVCASRRNQAPGAAVCSRRLRKGNVHQFGNMQMGDSEHGISVADIERHAAVGAHQMHRLHLFPLRHQDSHLHV